MSTTQPQTPQSRPKPGILPNLPNISTTISSILQTSTPLSNSDSPAHAHEQSPPVDASLTPPTTSLASYLPASVSSAPTTMTAWFKKPAAKSAIKAPRAASRDSSPSKSVAFSSTSSAELERRGSQETTSDRGRKSKRSSKPKSSYSICYAPPRSGNRHKIQVRARPLLQLHKLESRARPRPEFELLPSAIFSARLNKAIARFSPSKHGGHATDLALVRADKYHEHESSAVEEDESMDILAIFSGLSKGCHADSKARICLEQGVEWEAYRLSNGGYECITTDAHGLTRVVRWVPKKSTKPADAADDTPAPKKFKFSAISPNSRRHPVIANLSSASLDIADVYSLPAPSRSATSPPSSPLERSESDLSLTPGEKIMTTTDEMRNIITATSVFVALCEGWCPGYRSEEGLMRSPSQKSVSSTKRNMSLERETLRRNGSMRQALRSPSFFRTSSYKHDSRPSSSASSVILDNMPIHPIPEATASSSEDAPTPRRARADTVSTVIVRDSGSQWRPTYDDETEDEAEQEPEEHDIKSDKGSEAGVDGCADQHRSRATTLASATTMPEKRTVSASTAHSDASGYSAAARAEREKKLSTASTVVGEDHAAGRKPVVAQTRAKQPKKKSRWLSRLLCGML